MQRCNSFAVVVGSLAACLITTNAQAQSAFAGFYGQISTGYESNQLGSVSGSSNATPYAKSDTVITGSSQTFGGAPLVLGAGYYWQASEKWLIGLGADYSALSQTSSNIPLNRSNAAGSTLIPAGETLTNNGTNLQLSNRFNLFLTPAYAIDKDKLVYLKAGYSQVSAQLNRTTTVTRTTANGVSTTSPTVGGSQSSNQAGYLIGLGYKQIITSGMYGFIEGNYMSYSAPSYSFNGINGADRVYGASTSSTRTVTNSFASLNAFQALIGLGYAF
jgi:outer membrane immunogenic protein